MRLLPVFLFAGLLIAQPPAALNVQSPAPASPVVSAAIVGASGQASYNYYVIANFPTGATISAPVAVRNAANTLSGTNYVSIGWNAIPGAIGYDVLRFTSPSTFGGTSCSSCVVTLGTMSTSALNTTNGSLTSYTIVGSAGFTSGSLYVNNRDYNPPQWRKVVNGVDTQLSLAAPAAVSKMYHAVASVQNGDADMKIWAIGDSTTFGVACGNPANLYTCSYPTRLIQELNTQLLPTASGLVCYPNNDGVSSAWVFGAGWGKAGNGNGGGSCGPYVISNSTTTNTMTYTPPAGPTYNSYNIYYLAWPSGGTVTLTAGSGAPSTVDTHCGGCATPVIVKVVVTDTAASALPIAVTRVSGEILIIAVEPFNSAIVRARVGNGGEGGSFSSDWSSVTALAFLRFYAPDLLLANLGINDAGQAVSVPVYQTNMQAIVTAGQASGDVFLISPGYTDPGLGANYALYEPLYVNALSGLSTVNNLRFVDIANRWALNGGYNPLWVGGLHPTGPGYWDIATAVVSTMAINAGTGPR